MELFNSYNIAAYITFVDIIGGRLDIHLRTGVYIMHNYR